MDNMQTPIHRCEINITWCWHEQIILLHSGRLAPAPLPCLAKYPHLPICWHGSLHIGQEALKKLLPSTSLHCTCIQHVQCSPMRSQKFYSNFQYVLRKACMHAFKAACRSCRRACWKHNRSYCNFFEISSASTSVLTQAQGAVCQSTQYSNSCFFHATQFSSFYILFSRQL